LNLRCLENIKGNIGVFLGLALEIKKGYVYLLIILSLKLDLSV